MDTSVWQLALADERHVAHRDAPHRAIRARGGDRLPLQGSQRRGSRAAACELTPQHDASLHHVAWLKEKILLRRSILEMLLTFQHGAGSYRSVTGAECGVRDEKGVMKAGTDFTRKF